MPCVGGTRSWRAKAAPAAAGLLTIVLAAVAAPLAVAGHQNPATTAPELLAVTLPFAVVGLLVAWRQRGNPIGWLMLSFALGFMISIDAGSYDLAVYRYGHGWPLGAVSLVLYVLWEPALVLGPVAVLLFPDGRLPSARWRWVLGAYFTIGLFLLALLEFKSVDAIAHHQTRVDSSGQLTVFDQTSGYGGVAFILIAYAMLLAVWLAAMGRQVLAWRRSSGDRREQFKWLVSGAVVCFASLLTSVLLSSSRGWWHAVGDVAIIGAAALPVSIGIGILKYRLYDIDRIISRTVAYAIVTGLLVGVYAGLVLLATQVFRFHSSVAVAAATLAAAALFNPLRRRVQRAVARRFNRARYDADQTVAAFAARLKDAVDLDSVQGDLAGVVQHALEPAHVSVWVSQSLSIRAGYGTTANVSFSPGRRTAVLGVMDNKVALVTGGSRGIGAEIVRRLAAEGADVGFTYRTGHDEAEQVAAQVRGLGRRALTVQADLAEPAAAAAVVTAVAGEFGRLDILAG